MQAKLHYMPDERKWWHDSPNGPHWYADLYTRLPQWVRAEQSGPPGRKRRREVSEDSPSLTIEQIEAMSDEELATLSIPFDPHKSNLFAIRQERKRAAAST